MRDNTLTRSFLFMLLVIASSMVSCGSDSEKPSGFQGPGFEVKNTDKALVEKTTEWYDAVGTIRPRTETSIESQVPAQILKVLVSPGSRVKKGDTLFILDNRQFTSRLSSAKEGLKAAQAGREQANQGLVAAKARFAQAEAEYNRVKKYYETEAATHQQLEQAKAAYLTAQAAVKQAKESLVAAEAGIRQAGEGVNDAGITQGYTVIKAPDTGEVLKRMAEPGDIAIPGKPLAVMRTSGALRIEAYVREGLIEKVKPGMELDVEIKTLGARSRATVNEVVPYADPRTRTFLVKAQLPAIDGVYPGMYGKLMIPVIESNVITVPSKAVKTVGQIQMVLVRDKDRWTSRYIKTGLARGERKEVLSGLSGGEIVGY